MSVPKKLSVTALSQQSPLRLIEHTMPVVSKNTNELKASATSYLSPSARCAPVNGLAGCYVSSIGKPHEYFDLTGSPSHPTVPILGGAFSIIMQRTGVALDFFTLPTATFLAWKYFGTAVVSIREVYAMAAR